MTLDEARMKYLIMRNGGKATERKIEIFRVPQFMSKRVNVICVDGIPFCTVRGKRTTSSILAKLSGFDVTVCDARINKLAEEINIRGGKMKNNTCCHCMYSEGIEGRNSMIGCNLDKKLHDMDDSCLCFQSVYRINAETELPERSK